jgi:hypothetical protein
MACKFNFRLRFICNLPAAATLSVQFARGMRPRNFLNVICNGGNKTTTCEKALNFNLRVMIVTSVEVQYIRSLMANST